MKPLKIKNEYGETIEIKFDDDGAIKIRHSDIDATAWGKLQQYDKRMRQASVQEFLTKKGIDMSNPLMAGMVKEMAGRAGGYIVLRGKTYQVDAKEIAMIHEAVKQAGGIVPNWSVGG